LECFGLAYRAWSPYAGNYVLDAVSTAELRELGYASPCGIELGSPIRQDLIRFAISSHRFFQKLDGVRLLGCGGFLSLHIRVDSSVFSIETKASFIPKGNPAEEFSAPSEISSRRGKGSHDFSLKRIL